MASKITVWQLNSTDLKTIRKIAAWYHSEWDTPVERTIRRLSSQAGEDVLFQLILKKGEEVVATGGVCRKPNILNVHPRLSRYGPWLSAFYTQAGYRGQGLGQQLLTEIERHAREKNLPHLYLYTFTAESLYRRNGWEPVEKVPYKGRETVVMVKPLRNLRDFVKVTTAITRKPGKNFAAGLTVAGLGKPEIDTALRQHEAYCRALETCCLSVTVLEADERYPDGCFVEDTALVTEKMAVITRPGDSSRRGEPGKIAELLSTCRKITSIQPPGTLDGGDVLRVGDHFYIGRSRRTNRAGARQLAKILSANGYTSSEVAVQQVLHLKTGITSLGADTFIAIDGFTKAVEAGKVIRVPPEEAYAANCLLINNHLLMPKGFPKTKRKLRELGYELMELEMSEFRKMDGGLTCLSLLF